MRNASVLLCGLLVGAACTDAGESIVVLQNALPGDNCDGTATDSFISQGVIDVASPFGYTMRAVIENRAVAEETVERRAQLEGYNVDITYPGTGTCSTDSSLTSYSRLVGVSLAANSTSVVNIELLPRELVASCSVSGDSVIDIVAEVEFFGTLDGGDIESAKFKYPIQVCSGCLVEDLGMCSELTGAEVIEEGSSCNPYQDLPVSCCTNSASQFVCPAEQEIIET